MTQVLLEGDDCRLEASEHTLLVFGRVGFDDAAALAAAGSTWIEAHAAGVKVRFDLSAVDQVSSAAISVLLEWSRRSGEAGGEVGGVRLSPPLARLTELAELDRLLPVELDGAAVP